MKKVLRILCLLYLKVMHLGATLVILSKWVLIS